ncbi:hypothetical protein JKP88DRAFT_323428 [Tribonema minus]|uniref:Uncharacterized protein n=1 Tax=Tribonema minus TaxID=303371 RepID=A0A836CCL8_9STRA|nr:hypothetical protein JKP88DRAFT_323428 [Tribonema minus]
MSVQISTMPTCFDQQQRSASPGTDATAPLTDASSDISSSSSGGAAQAQLCHTALAGRERAAAALSYTFATSLASSSSGSGSSALAAELVQRRRALLPDTAATLNRKPPSRASPKGAAGGGGGGRGAAAGGMRKRARGAGGGREGEGGFGALPQVMSPAASTGLLGLQEHDFLVLSMRMCSDDAIARDAQQAIRELLSSGSSAQPPWRNPPAEQQRSAAAAALSNHRLLQAPAASPTTEHCLSSAAASRGAAIPQHRSSGGGGLELGLAQAPWLGREAQREAALSAARQCRLWTSIAGGVLLRGVRDLEGSTGLNAYLRRAREVLKLCHDEPCQEVVRVYLNLAPLHFVMEDYPRFYRYVGCAERLCAAIEQQQSAQQAALRAQQAQAATGISADCCGVEDVDPGLPQALDMDIWFMLQMMRMFRGWLQAELDSSNTESSHESMHQTLGQFAGVKLRPGVDFGDKPPNNPIAGFAPDVQGLPTYNPTELQTVMEQGGGLNKIQAKAMARNNIVATSLTLLAEADEQALDALVSAATNAAKNISPAISGIDHRLLQIVHIIVTCHPSSYPAARAAGAQLRVILERLREGLGARYMHTASFDQLSIVTALIFLRVLDGDEAGCVAMLKLAVSSLQDAPGLLRFPPWWSAVRYTAALLVSAGMQREYRDLALVFNGLRMCGGANMLPEPGDLEGQAALHNSTQVRCIAVQRILWENRASGAAKVFLSHIHPFALDADTPPDNLEESVEVENEMQLSDRDRAAFASEPDSESDSWWLESLGIQQPAAAGQDAGMAELMPSTAANSLLSIDAAAVDDAGGGMGMGMGIGADDVAALSTEEEAMMQAFAQELQQAW